MNVLGIDLRLRVHNPRHLLPLILVVSFFSILQAESSAQTTTLTISNTVQAAGIDRPGINLGGLTAYGPQQLFKSLNYATGGYMPGTYWGSTFQCSAGGTTNTTTSWYNNITNTNGYKANWWVGATFVAIDAATGTSYGSGTITASTANTGSSGTTFTLSPAISAACNPSQSDVLIVRLNARNSNFTPTQVNSGICAAATWDTTDTDPLSTNTQQSLEMPTGCSSAFAMDQVLLNASNPVSSIASLFVPWINLNGSYTAGFKAKCLVSGCSIGWSVARSGGTAYVTYNTVNPSYSATPGASWTTYTKNFTAAETGAQTSALYLNLICTGTCLVQDVDVVEGSTMAANTTVFRDAVVYELQKLNPGSIRYMDGTQWCSDVADEIAPMGNRRWCGDSEYVNWLEGPPIGYNDVLALANLIGTDAWISVGLLNQASDWTTLINWLNTSGWISTFAASGHKIYLEDGNEAWNTGVPGTLFQGNGKAYGYTLGLKMAAAKSASGYNSSVVKLVANGWNAAMQGYSQYGWLALSLQAAGCTLGSRANCPDFVDNAPYTLNYLANSSIIGANVSTTGAPFLDEWAEITNLDSVTSPPTYATSVYLNQQYAKATYGLNTAVYEVNESTTAGIATTQLQLNQIDSSVGNALAMSQHVLLMQRDSQISGPIHVFTLAGPYNSYNGTTAGTALPLWGTTVSLATGPGQTPGAANVDRPLNIALEVINNAIGSNTNLVSASQSGTPTFSYAGGQPQNGTNTILANAAVPYVNCFVYANSAQTNWTTICFNNNLTSSENVTLAGAGVPSGTVTQTIFPNSSNAITDNNEGTYVGPLSVAPIVTYPPSTTTSGTSYTIPPASMIALTYSSAISGGSSTLATPTFSPAAGSYSGTQTVTVSLPSGSTGCVGINTTPTAPTPGTCGSGSTTYTGPITVSSTETVNVIATEAGNTNSALGTATYTITSSTAATPTFSPAAGTYTSAQSVAISDATAGTTIYYTTNGSTPTTSSTAYSGPITVSANETIQAIAVAPNYTNSAVGSAAYTINTTAAATPTFSPVAGTYTSAQSVAISDATAGATIYYTTNGSTPTTSSTAYSGPITVSASETIQAIAVAPNYSNSAVGSATYTINATVASTPTFSPVAGTYTSAQTVTISDATAGTTIYYTTNGSTPTTTSAVYSGPISVSASETIQAIAVATNFSNSSVGSAAYTINTTAAATPTFSPVAGTYTSAQTVTINDATAGTTIYYTTDGSTPTTSSAVYSGPISVSASETIQAIAVATNFSNSAVGFAAYTISSSAALPVFTPIGGTYSATQTVTISDATSGATIYYTTDGSTPTISSAIYTGPIIVSANETLEAIAAATGYSNSAVATAAYTINSLVTSTPNFLPNGGTFTSPQTVTIGCATPNATIYYTTNGTIPTTSSTVYTGSFTVSSTELIQAIATSPGHSNSTVGAVGYTINGGSAATPTFSPAAGTYTSAQSVTISDATAGSTIHYTTNGSTPTASSAVYSGAITVSATETLQAIAIASGYSNSAVASAAYTINTTPAATPTFSPIAGTYTSAQTVTISDATAGATIYYTTNGSTPTTSSSVYSGPITVSSTETVQALAVATNYPNSAVGFAAYTISPLPTSTPNFSPAGGTYTSAQTVTISDATPGATVYYTTNGSTPTTSSTVYAGPITVSASETLEAIAAATGYSNSAVAAAAYIINTASTATPNFSPAPGIYTSPQTVTISDSTAGATIYYTTNGSVPTTSSAVYSGPITVSATETLAAIAVAAGYSNSTVATATYTINTASTATPSFSPSPGTYTSPQTVTISDATPGSTIYYTTNGSVPTTSSPVYSGPITVSTSETLAAIAVATGYSNSAVAAAAYTITPVTAATPNFSPAGGAYTSVQTVVLSDATPGATIYYTTNGAAPTTSSPVYSGPITVSASETIRAIAAATGYTTSAVGSAAYTITLQTASPAFNPTAGTYTSTQTITISDTTPGATIYYTTNGSTPTTSSAIYSGPITVSTSETLQAIAAVTGYSNSAIVSATYTINPTATSTPNFSPAAGTYTSTQTVTISDATPGATIYYTTNGATPTTSSTVYSGPITVSATETVMAIAAFTGYTNSPVASAAYTITPTATSTPNFSPAGGTYASAQTVTISDATPGATIYYTTNGSTPTTGSAVYAGPISVASTELVQAIAVATGYSASTVGSASFTITLQAATPIFLPAGGTFVSAQTVIVSDATPGTTIYYTTNGSTPTTSSAIYSGPIDISSSELLQAVAVAAGYSTSTVEAAGYVINVPSAAAPSFSLAPGTYNSAQTLTLSDSTVGATIHYTTNGSVPTTSSAIYTGPISISTSEIVQAIAAATGYSNSAISSAAYTINAASAATPNFSLAAGTYTSAQTLTLSDSTPGTTIYYTTNGSIPTTSSQVYAGPITISASETVMAIAAATGYSSSSVGSATYNINFLTAPTPTFSPASGTYTSVQTVTISDAFAGATLYYTADGSTPTTSSAVYSSPITVSSSQILKAIAAATNYLTSAVGSASYTINTTPAATPSFSLSAGTYTSTQAVTINDSTAGAVLYYTTDGSAPTTNSAVYSGPIIVSSSEILQAIAVASGLANSAIGSAAYTIDTTPNLSLAVSPNQLSVTIGQTVTATVTLTSTNSFNFLSTLTCSGLPQGASCIFASPTVTVTSGKASTTLTITAPASLVNLREDRNLLFPASTLAVAFCLLGLNRKRRLRMMLLALIALGLGVSVTGCASNYLLTPVTITATSGSTQATVPLQLTVSQ